MEKRQDAMVPSENLTPGKWSPDLWWSSEQSAVRHTLIKETESYFSWRAKK
jgi:hypothetical protein